MEENLEKDMTPVLLEDLGMRYPTKESKKKSRYGLYQCQYCGKEWEAVTANITGGKSLSCGCFSQIKSKELFTTHGLKYHPLYTPWYSMKYRCYNIKAPSYKNYGARGIQVCERWLDIENFIEDMYPTWEEGLSLDRIDVNGNYEPDNCRWTDLTIQACNTRDIKATNTSGYRGVSWHKASNRWRAIIGMYNIQKHLGSFHTALEAAKAYERYVRINNLEHNFTPVLSEEEIGEIINKGTSE